MKINVYIYSNNFKHSTVVILAQDLLIHVILVILVILHPVISSIASSMAASTAITINDRDSDLDSVAVDAKVALIAAKATRVIADKATMELLSAEEAYMCAMDSFLTVGDPMEENDRGVEEAKTNAGFQAIDSALKKENRLRQIQHTAHSIARLCDIEAVEKARIASLLSR